METHIKDYEVSRERFSLELSPGGVFVPTSTSLLIGEALNVRPGSTVIDLGCGSGFFSILAAKKGAAKVYAVDVMPEAAELTRRNARRNGVDNRVETFVGSLFDPLPLIKADLVIDDVSGVAETVARASPWYPPCIPSGGADGADPTVAMFKHVGRYLSHEGRLLFPVLSLANEQRILQEANKWFTDLTLRVKQLFPLFPEMITALRELQQKLGEQAFRVIRKGSRFCWELRVFEAQLPSSFNENPEA